MNEAITVSIITGIAAILVAWLSSRNKATQASVDALREELHECKENNKRERESERVIREEIALKLKEALEEKNRILEEKNRLFDEKLTLMQKILLDTQPKVKKSK